jgi:hypothetical protein
MKRQVADPDSAQAQGSVDPGQNQGAGNRSSNTFTYLLIVLFVVAALIVIYEAYLMFGAPGAPAVLQTSSESSVPIYLTTSQAELLLNSPLQSYSTADLFNPASQINMSDLESYVPTLAGNVTSAWITTATGSNATANASIEYFIFETSNSVGISGSLYSAISSEFNSSMPTSYGSTNGLSYSYGIYKNSTYGTQVISGWKAGGAVLVIVQSYPSFTANKASLLRIAANDTP